MPEIKTHSNMNKYWTTITFLLFLTFPALSQQVDRQMGPVIKDFGPVFSVDNPDFKTDTTLTYQVIFDIHNTPDDPSKVNPMLNTLARFLNMHAQAGVPLKKLKVAGVFHNKATHDVLDNEGYRAKYGVDNPNLALLAALAEAKAELFICGQSISARGVNRAQIHSSVEVALSAMTVILSFQSTGYSLIRF